MFRISALFTILMFSLASVIEVVRMPMSVTTPRKPSTSMMSPHIVLAIKEDEHARDQVGDDAVGGKADD